MKKILLGSVFALALAATPSFAADMSYPVKAPRVAPAPAFSWTGFYLGVHGGGGWGKFDTWSNKFDGAGDPFEPDNWTQTAGGFMAGGQIGYNFQLNNNVVVGIEADIAWSDIAAKESGNYDGDSYSYGTEVKWFGTVRGRLGYAWNNVMLYGTGGAAFGKVHMFDSNSGGSGVPASYDDVIWGWTAGAGFEWAFANNWSVKGEYLYIDLGSIDAEPFLDCCGGHENRSTDVKFHTLKLGLNYRF